MRFGVFSFSQDPENILRSLGICAQMLVIGYLDTPTKAQSVPFDDSLRNYRMH